MEKNPDPRALSPIAVADDPGEVAPEPTAVDEVPRACVLMPNTVAPAANDWPWGVVINEAVAFVYSHCAAAGGPVMASPPRTTALTAACAKTLLRLFLPRALVTSETAIQAPRASLKMTR